MATLTHKDLTDTEKATIIEEVRFRPGIWDVTKKDHLKKAVVDKLWKEIANFMTKESRILTGFLGYFFIYFIMFIIFFIGEYKSLVQGG